MTVFSMLTTFSAVALLALPASGGRITFDMLSNGKHWWGGQWAHQPNGGSTNDCICIKGTKMNGEQDAVCFDGMRISRGNGFIAGVYNPSKTIPFDGNYPIDISTDGRDGLWFDRLRVETNKGKRWHGADNTIGWCLSRDRRESFDKYATMDFGICFTTLSIQPNGEMLGDHSGELGYYRSSRLAAKTKAMCKKLGRRRAEMPSQAESDPQETHSQAESDSSDSVDVELLELLDADPTGESPNQVHSERDALVVKKLHKAIRGMVQSRFPWSLMTSDVTDGHIDKILNSAMFEAEHIVEQKEHDGEVKELRASDGSQPESAEPEESAPESAEPEESAGSAEPESNNNRNVQGRLQDLEESP